MPKEKNLAYLAENRSPVKVGTGESKKTAKTEEGKATGIVTYRIYHDGKIEKHIPKTIKQEYKQKYKYIYHDKNNIQHDICVADSHETIEKNKGSKLYSKPTHSEIVSDNNVSEGQTSRRVIYKNGDVAEYGINDGKYFWRLYTSVTEKTKIEIVRMPDALNYSQSGIIIKYAFSNTQRRYTSPYALAGFIGALAACGYTDIYTTGSCFKEGTCFPSKTHVNGKSIDTLYLDRPRETKFIKAMEKFNFEKQRTGSDGTHSYEGTAHDSGHNNHLHSEFEKEKVIIIKE